MIYLSPYVNSLRQSGLVLVVASLMTGCGQTLTQDAPVATQTTAPVALTPQRQVVVSGASYDGAGPLDRAELDKAIERFRVTKNRTASPVDVAPADLNGDGQPEAVVLFTGQDWCSATGCSLVVFQREPFGFRPVSHVVSVRGPVLGAPLAGGNWRDLIVRSGGGAAPQRSVRLTFGASGYPGNALLQPEADSAAVASATNLLNGSAAPALTSAQTGPVESRQ